MIPYMALLFTVLSFAGEPAAIQGTVCKTAPLAYAQQHFASAEKGMEVDVQFPKNMIIKAGASQLIDGDCVWTVRPTGADRKLSEKLKKLKLKKKGGFSARASLVISNNVIDNRTYSIALREDGQCFDSNGVNLSQESGFTAFIKRWRNNTSTEGEFTFRFEDPLLEQAVCKIRVKAVDPSFAAPSCDDFLRLGRLSDKFFNDWVLELHERNPPASIRVRANYVAPPECVTPKEVKRVTPQERERMKSAPTPVEQEKNEKLSESAG